jgi:hypothetical protein
MKTDKRTEEWKIDIRKEERKETQKEKIKERRNGDTYKNERRIAIRTKERIKTKR